MALSKHEKKLAESVERGEWRRVRDSERESRRYQEYARATFRKDKRVNIRISEKDLVSIQKRAVAEGLPYQTLMASVLHKFVAGRLVEKG